MSVNIFGTARGNKISENDQKFKTLSLNLTSKLDKSGGNVDGDLKMLLNGDEIRTFGVSDISSDKSVSFLLGDVENQIRHNYGHAIKIAASHGVKFTSPGGEICQIGTQHDANLSMRNNYIKDLHDPEFAQDAASKYYVDNIHSYNGYIPILESNISCLGFSAVFSIEKIAEIIIHRFFMFYSVFFYIRIPPIIEDFQRFYRVFEKSAVGRKIDQISG